MSRATASSSVDLKKALTKIENDEPLTPAEGSLVRTKVDALVQRVAIDVERARAAGIDIERLRALGVDEDRIALMCDGSLTSAERLRALGIADDGEVVVLRSAEELEAHFGDPCEPSS